MNNIKQFIESIFCTFATKFFTEILIIFANFLNLNAFNNIIKQLNYMKKTTLLALFCVFTLMLTVQSAPKKQEMNLGRRQVQSHQNIRKPNAQTTLRSPIQKPKTLHRTNTNKQSPSMRPLENKQPSLRPNDHINKKPHINVSHRRPQMYKPTTRHTHIRPMPPQQIFIFDNTWIFSNEYDTEQIALDIRDKIFDLLKREGINNITSVQISILELQRTKDTIYATVEALMTRDLNGKQITTKTTTTVSAFTENFLKNKIAREIVESLK